MPYREVGRVALLAAGPNTRVRIVYEGDRPFLVTEQKEEPDVTAECTAQLVKSSHSSGYYVLIKHGDKGIIALGVDDTISKHQLLRVSSGYKLVKSPDAVVSFRVVKR